MTCFFEISQTWTSKYLSRLFPVSPNFSVRTLWSENKDGILYVGTWKSAHYACAKSRKPLLESSVARDGREKVSCDVLMKTCNILSKIMVVLDIYGIKVLTIFTVEYHTTFFEFILKDWACIKCFACLFDFFTFFLHLSSVESGWKSRRIKAFYLVNQFLVCRFDSSHSTCFFNCFFNF